MGDSYECNNAQHDIHSFLLEEMLGAKADGETNRFNYSERTNTRRAALMRESEYLRGTWMQWIDRHITKACFALGYFLSSILRLIIVIPCHIVNFVVLAIIITTRCVIHYALVMHRLVADSQFNGREFFKPQPNDQPQPHEWVLNQAVPFYVEDNDGELILDEVKQYKKEHSPHIPAHKEIPVKPTINQKNANKAKYTRQVKRTRI